MAKAPDATKPIRLLYSPSSAAFSRGLLLGPDLLLGLLGLGVIAALRSEEVPVAALPHGNGAGGELLRLELRGGGTAVGPIRVGEPIGLLLHHRDARVTERVVVLGLGLLALDAAADAVGLARPAVTCGKDRLDILLVVEGARGLELVERHLAALDAPAQFARGADLPGGGAARALDALLVDAQHEHLLHAAGAFRLGQLALVVGGEHGHELVGLVHGIGHQRGDLAVLAVDGRQRAVAALAVDDTEHVAVRHDHGRVQRLAAGRLDAAGQGADVAEVLARVLLARADVAQANLPLLKLHAISS